MPSILASLGKRLFVGGVTIRVEHLGLRAIARDAFPLQIGDVLG